MHDSMTDELIVLPVAASKAHLPLLERQFVRYFIASALALVLDTCTFAIGLRLLHWAWPIAATAGFLAGTVSLYICSIRWVFRVRRLGPNAPLEFASFAAAGVAGLGVTQAVLYVGIERLALPPEVVRIGAAGVTFVFNYGARRLFLFRARASQ